MFSKDELGCSCPTGRTPSWDWLGGRDAAPEHVENDLVKTHLPKADLELVGDGVPEDCSDAEWEANHVAVLEITEWIVAEL